MSGLLIVVVSLRSIVKRLKTSSNFEKKTRKEVNLRSSNRLPLRKLLYEDHETFSCSSSEADDIDSLELTVCRRQRRKRGLQGAASKAALKGLIQKYGSSKILFTRVIVMVRILLCS
ncbi:hypothetical protein NC651_023554 [Populus alba x Populus x berolinensis]|nr:hypothetical protein NC651_023554 [Populus alba x Populus x berolinensis]